MRDLFPEQLFLNAHSLLQRIWGVLENLEHCVLGGLPAVLETELSLLTVTISGVSVLLRSVSLKIKSFIKRY